METQSSGELDCENDATPSVRSNPRTVRKAISLKLKGKGKGGKGGRGRTTRAAKKAEEAAAVLDVTAVASESQSSKSEVLTEVEPMEQDKPPTFDMEQDIFKLEAPTFTTIDRGPPEPIHNNSKLRWDHKVSLMGAKVLNPAIHVCKICSLPILLYGRMIPCKHVFCYECAVKSEKICPRCHEKVTRVEHTGLGTIHICIFGATKRNGSDGCNRTYLSHRDLQAHINHRHLRQPATTTAAPAPTNNVTTTVKTGEGGRSAGGGGSTSLTLSHSHHHHSPASALDYRTRGHSRGHPAESNYRSSQVAMNAYTSEVQHGYDQRTNQLLAVAGGAPQQTVLTPYSLTVVPQTVSAAVALQQQVVAAATVASISGVQGVTYTTAIPVMSVQAASNMPQARTNLITVPIHDDSNANAAAEYLYQQQQQQQQQQQAFQMPPLVGPPYTAPPPSVTYQTTATYVGAPQAPVTSFPPPPYPPPPIYQPGQLPPPPPPAHMHPQPRYPTGPIPMRPRFGTPPPPAHYEDHSHLASMQYPPNLWTQQQQQAQQTQARSNGPPPLIQPQQRFY